MTEQQYERWKQLSLGLANTYKSLTPQRHEKLLLEVGGCIDWIVCNGLETIEDWDNGVRGEYGRDQAAGERMDEYLWERNYEFERTYYNGEVDLIRGRFGNMLSACVRAGFDVAVSPSAGVIGFSVGNLIDACGGEIPDWVSGFFSDSKALLADHWRAEPWR